MADIDFGQLSEALNDKSDRDLRNVDTTAKADAVIDYQEPTADNNYTWYRKYKSGWVEQGGYKNISFTANTDVSFSITFPIIMSNTDYTSETSFRTGWITSTKGGVEAKYTTYMSGFAQSNNTQTGSINWMVCGMATN